MFTSLPVSSFNGTVNPFNDRFIIHWYIRYSSSTHLLLCVAKKWIVVITFIVFFWGGAWLVGYLYIGLFFLRHILKKMSYFPTIFTCLPLSLACSVHVVIATPPVFLFISSHVLILLSVVLILFMWVYLSLFYLVYDEVFSVLCDCFCNFVIFTNSYYYVQIRFC